MLVRGRPSSVTNVLVARAVEVLVLAVASYFGFLADVKKSVMDTQASVAKIQEDATAAKTKAASCEERIEAHIKSQQPNQ